MQKSRFILFFFLSFFCCSAGSQYGNQPKSIKRQYIVMARTNTQGICDFEMLADAWYKLYHNFYKSIKNKEIFSYSLLGLEKASLLSIDMPIYLSDAKYNAKNFWKLLEHISQFSGGKSRLCYASLKSLASNLDDDYARFYSPKKARHALMWMTNPRAVSKDKRSLCSLKKKIVYCKITGFDGLTINQFLKSFNALPAHKRKIIFDLRNNTGGLIEVLKQMLGLFWLKDKKAFILVSSDNSRKISYAIDGKRVLFKDYKSVLLISKRTFSAGEIFASVVKDYDLATLIGEKTFGKGVIQNPYFIKGAVFKFSIKKILSPKGRSYNGFGVVPHIFVENKKNRPLKAAIRFLSR